MKNGLILICAVLLNNISFSCGNEYGFTLDGERVHTRYFFLSERMSHFDKVHIQQNLESLYLKVENGEDDFKIWSNIALNLMKLGQADSSIQILRPLVLKNPKEYNLIANLGTAFELTGDLDSALYYISLGYEINPKSHLRSEWVHIAILEAKISERKHKGWLKTHSVLDLEKLIKRVGVDVRGRKADRISQEIFLQIRTRVPFTPAPNKIIANILETLGDFNLEVGTYENALLAYAYAMDFEKKDNSHYQIIQKIKKLNNKRIDNVKMEELPVTFQRMLKRSQIAPQLLVLGLADFAEGQDVYHLDILIKNDSIKLLVNQMDSIRLDASEQIEMIEKNKDKEMSIQKNDGEMKSYLFLGIGALGGGFIMFLLRRKKK